MRTPPALLLFVLAASPLEAQTVAGLIAEGQALENADPRQALARYQAALALDSTSYEASWRAAVTEVAIGQDVPDTVRSVERDSSYAAAERLARRAVALAPDRPEGHFALAMALGRIALTKGRKDRLKYAGSIHAEASRAIAIDSSHDGAHHILGLWHAEARRLSGLERFMARTVLGGGILGQASWDQAIEHLETAVRLDPDRIYHRLDLARVYVDRKRYSAARRELDRIADLPDRYRLDPRYREEATRLAREIATKRDGGREG